MKGKVSLNPNFFGAKWALFSDADTTLIQTKGKQDEDINTWAI